MPPVKHYSSSEVNQYELSSRLLSLTENNTSYTLTQINGQRIYRKAPHAWSGPEPSRNCEVFIGRIPHDCFEDILVPLFRQAGELFEFRLMINFSGWNRGYAFAMYTTDTEANNAIRMFNNYMIRPSWQLGVCPSINNCRIFISRIPPTTPSAEIVRLLYALTDEVQEVRIRRSIASCAAIVEYKSHRGAAMARKALVAAAAAAWGCGARPAVDWSLPQTPQMFKQYREVGRWTPERGVELTRAPEESTPCSPPPAAPSYTLEPWSQARRLRMIQEAQRSAMAAAEWSTRMSSSMECMVNAMGGLGVGGGLAPVERAVWAPPSAPAPRAPPSQDFNPWTARHPLLEFSTPASRAQSDCCLTSQPIKEVCTSSVYCLQLFCVACLVTKRVSQDDEARLALFLQKYSREWSFLTSVTWDSVGGAFADAIYGGYVIITFVLVVARVLQEIPQGKRILEGCFLGFGMVFFIVLGGLELASLDSVPRTLTVNASVLGSLSLVVAALFLVDLMGPRIYHATTTSQTDPISSPKVEKKVSIVTPPTTNGHLPNEQNGHIPAERPKNLDLDTKTKEIKIDTTLLEGPQLGSKEDIDKDNLQKTKFGSLRNGIESGNYVRLSDPLSEPDRLHYEKELAKFHERYFRDYLDSFEGKVSCKENYLPELQTPVFAKLKPGRKTLYDDSPGFDQKSPSRSPSRAKTVSTPTLQQLEDYLRGSARSRRADTPALFPMEPIQEKDTEGRASGTPTDPGYVQYAADRWPEKRDLRTPRHSPTQ